MTLSRCTDHSTTNDPCTDINIPPPARKCSNFTRHCNTPRTSGCSSGDGQPLVKHEKDATTKKTHSMSAGYAWTPRKMVQASPSCDIGVILGYGARPSSYCQNPKGVFKFCWCLLVCEEYVCVCECVRKGVRDREEDERRRNVSEYGYKCGDRKLLYTYLRAFLAGCGCAVYCT